MAEDKAPRPVSNEARQLELLEELLVWTRFANRASLVAMLETVLKDPKHLRAYESTDGERTQGEVATFAGLSQPAISTLWARWRRMGLATEQDRRSRHLARPSDLGLEIPSLEDANKIKVAATADGK